MKKLILLLPLLALIGCTPVERQAYRAIVGAKAFLDYVKSKHPECPASNADPCPYLLKATLSKDLLIDAVNVYCASDTWDKGGNCTPPTNKLSLIHI